MSVICFFTCFLEQAIIDADGNVEQALEDLLAYFQACETALKFCYAEETTSSQAGKEEPRPSPPVRPPEKTQEELDREYAIRLQAVYDEEGAHQMGRLPPPQRSYPQTAGPQMPGLNLDFTFLTDEQRVLLVNAAKQAIAPLFQGFITKIAMPPFDQSMGKQHQQ